MITSISLVVVISVVMVAYLYFKGRTSSSSSASARLILHKSTRSEPRTPRSAATGAVYGVTGGHGFIGSHVVEALLERGETSIFIFDVTPSPLFEKEQKQGTVVFKSVDLSDAASVQRAFQELKIEVVIHTAARVDFSSRMAFQFSVVYDMNVKVTQNVMEAAKLSHSVSKIVYLSTADVVLHTTSASSSCLSMYTAQPNPPAHTHVCSDDSSNQLAFNEETATVPSSYLHSLCHYTSTKLLSEQLILKEADSKNADGKRIQTVALRPSGIFGERDPNFTYVFYDDTPLFHVPTFTDFNYVRNIVHAIFCAEQAMSNGEASIASSVASASAKVSGEAFFLMTDEKWSMKRVIAEMDVAWGRTQKRATVPLMPMRVLATVVEWLIFFTRGRIRPLLGPLGNLTPVTLSILEQTSMVDDAKARQRLGFQSVYTTKQGVDFTVNFCKRIKEANAITSTKLRRD